MQGEQGENWRGRAGRADRVCKVGNEVEARFHSQERGDQNSPFAVRRLKYLGQVGNLSVQLDENNSTSSGTVPFQPQPAAHSSGRGGYSVVPLLRL